MEMNNIRVERARRKITQQELAKNVGVSRQTIHALENGKFTPNARTLQRIAKYLNCSMEYLLVEPQTE